MLLLAQTEQLSEEARHHIEIMEWWLKTGSMYGLGFVVIALGIGFAFWALYLLVNGSRKYVPLVISTHLQNVNANTSTMQCLAESYERQADSFQLLVQKSDGFRCGHHLAVEFDRRQHEERLAEERKKADEAKRATLALTNAAELQTPPTTPPTP